MAEVEQGTEKKSSKMMMMIVALVVLLAGGGGAYYFMFMGDEAAVEEGAEATKENEAEPEEEEVEGVDTALTYFEMDKPFVVNFPKSSGISLLQISIALSVEGVTAVELLNKHQPMIRNNFLMLMSGQIPQDLKTEEGKEKLIELMHEEVDKVMKKMGAKNKVQDVFFTSFVMQ
ncbi:MAG: flagellar basal body-associated FliL family protein [Methyloprofundus sp.]|nr:flagellar basal body-associated FliL family protein [Methyloprofundus sp.]MBW6453582.1 flagellar basal body-associated FliL family protein [Methyloprofundus sp.]